MDQIDTDFPQSTASYESFLSNKEFLQIEKNCEVKDTDEEIKLIFNEINKLTASSYNNIVSNEEIDDVELILKRAEDISHETNNLLRSAKDTSNDNHFDSVSQNRIPVIKVTEAVEVEPTRIGNIQESINKDVSKHGNENVKEKSHEIRRKSKIRPYSAGVIDNKKKEAVKISRFASNSPKKSNIICKHESIIEELKDTNERIKALELMNVQLNEDNKLLRKKLDQVNEEKYVADIKLVESEKFLNRLSKEYENRSNDFKSVKSNESKILAELSKERNERKNLIAQHEKDVHVIQDLQRQVKEMELILKRKHPDSVSALIIASKSSTVEDNKKKLLEERLSRLERELKDKEDHFHSVLVTLQEKFGEMKQKYECHIIDVERQLMEERKTNTELKSKINKLNLSDAAVQTATILKHNTSTQTLIKSDRASSAVTRTTQNSALILNKLKEDSHLIATIKGLQAELTVKQRTIAKINRETEELRKNLRNLQKEKEALLNLNPQKKIVYRQNKSSENILTKMNNEMEFEMSELRRQHESLMQERSSLLDSLKRTNEEFILLKKKRIQDLHTLQLAHEKELMQMNMQVYPLQEEIKLLNRTVEILQERVRAADDKLARHQTGAGVRDAPSKDHLAGGDTVISKSINGVNRK